MNMNYAYVSQIEVQTLTRLKAPASVWSVVCCLNHFARETNTCFPSIKTISNWLGSVVPRRTIYFALKWLEDRDLINRNHSTSKVRFILKLRTTATNVINGVQDIAKRVQPVASELKHKKKSFYSKGKAARKDRRILAKKNAYGKANYPPDQRSKTERVTDRLVNRHLFEKKNVDAGGCLNISKAEKEAVQERIRFDKIWGSWLAEYHSDIFEAVKTIDRENYIK